MTGRGLNAEHIAVLAALVVVRRTGNMVHGLVVGMPVIWLAAILG